MKYIIYTLIILVFVSCGSGGGSKDSLLADGEGGEVLGSGESTDGYITPFTSSNKNSLVSDQFSLYQWFIKDNGIIFNEFRTSTVGGNDLNLDEVYPKYLGYNNGNPILVQVVDDGVDYNHEDLKDNINLVASYNAYTGLNDPTAFDFYNATHGTQVAGLIGAVGYNNIGLKGVAPSSNIAGFAFETTSSGGLILDAEILEKAWLTGVDANEISISNNSWGSCINNSTDYEEILKLGSEQLRDGKGRLYLFAAGNGRGGNTSCANIENSESANTSYISNSQYSITVAAINNDNKFASYSSSGSNILVSGYSGEPGLANIATTISSGTSIFFEDTWREDKKRNYTYSFSGTSAATPIVSGSLALVLEACPNLTYRDIKYLIAKKSTQVDIYNDSWIRNGAGLYHSNDYGYGLINVKGMIDECTETYSLLSERVALPIVSTNETTEIPYEDYALRTIDIPSNIKVEWVGLTLSIDSDYLDSLQIYLISPSGTKSKILHAYNQLGNKEYIYYNYYKEKFVSGFRFSSVAFVDENSLGSWKVQIISSKNGTENDDNDQNIDLGKLTDISLEIVGH